MFCPYNVVYKTFQQREYSYDPENEKCTAENLVELQTQQPIPCKQAECAAWQDGRCCYKG